MLPAEETLVCTALSDVSQISYYDDNHCSKLTYCFIMAFLNWKDMTLSPLFGLPLPRGSDNFCGRGGEPSLPGGERFPQGGGPSLLNGPLSVSD